MSQSRFSCIDIGNINIRNNLSINDNLLEIIDGSLLINKTPISVGGTSGSGSNINSTINNTLTVENGMNTPLTYFTDISGNIITNTALNYYSGSSPFGVGNSTGGLIATNEAKTLFYIGDDTVYLGTNLLDTDTTNDINIVSSDTTKILLNPDEKSISMSGNITLDYSTEGHLNLLRLNTQGSALFTSRFHIFQQNQSTTPQENNAIFGIYGPSIETYTNIDLSTYYFDDKLPATRISLLEENNTNSFNLMTKEMGSYDNELISRVFINANGFVGINTQSPTNNLHVNGTCYIDSGISAGSLCVGNYEGPLTTIDGYGTINTTRINANDGITAGNICVGLEGPTTTINAYGISSSDISTNNFTVGNICVGLEGTHTTINDVGILTNNITASNVHINNATISNMIGFIPQYQRTVTLSPSDIGELNTYPGITLVPYVTNKIIAVKSLQFQIIYNSTPYTADSGTYLRINYVGNWGINWDIPVNGSVGLQLLTNTYPNTNAIFYNSATQQCIPYQNSDLILMSNNSISNGDSDVKIRITYELLDVDF